MLDFTEKDVRNYARKNSNSGQLGSEGVVYRFEDYAIKLFKKVKGEEFMKAKEKKVRALMENEIEGFIKPIDLIYDEDNNFAGYAMEYVESKGDVADMCYKFGEHHRLDKKIEYLLKVEELIKKAHSLGYILNDVAIWNFLVKNNDEVIGIDVDNFQFGEYQSETTPSYYLPYYEGLCNTKGRNENSDKFSFGLFAIQSLIQYTFNNETLDYYRGNTYYLECYFKSLDISSEAKDELFELISPNPEKEWIGKTLEKISTNKFKYL